MLVRDLLFYVPPANQAFVASRRVVLRIAARVVVLGCGVSCARVWL